MSNLNNNIAKINAWKAAGEKLVFTNGCFDILHVGHVDYLSASAKLGTKLIVAVNSDDSVKRLEKGSGRPVNSELNRLKLISALECVALAFLFNEDTPLQAISEVMPNVLVKGADYDPAETDEKSKKYIVGSKEVLASKGEVSVIELTQGFSTTKLIERIKNAY